jgi:hypothetical protein
MGEWMYGSTISWPPNYLKVICRLHAFAALPPWKEPPVLGGPPEPIWTIGRGENSWPYWTATPTSRSSNASSAAIPTELPRLSRPFESWKCHVCSYANEEALRIDMGERWNWSTRFGTSLSCRISTVSAKLRVCGIVSQITSHCSR